MKYLFLSPVVWNFYNLQNQLLAASLADKGFDVVYIEPVKYKNRQKNSRFSNLSEITKPEKLVVVEREIIIFKSFFVFIYENFNNVLQIKKYKPDVVVSYDHLMSLLPCLYCYFYKIKFVFNVSDDWDNVPQARTARWMWKFVVKPIVTKFSYAIASISQKQLVLFSKKNKNTFILPNGVNMCFVDKINDIKENNSQNIVNFIANLRDWYDFDLLFEVFNEMPEIQLNIYGLGPMYETLSDKSKNFRNIRLMGNVKQEDTARLLKDSLIGIIPLKNNLLNDSTCPVKLFDYWAAKKAVVATPTFEIKSIGGDCVLFASTKDEWLTQMRFLIENPLRRELLGLSAHEKVIEKFNYDIITETFINKTNY